MPKGGQSRVPEGVKLTSAGGIQTRSETDEEFDKSMVRDGKDQADYLIVEMHPDMNYVDAQRALQNRITDKADPPRCVNLQEIRIRVGDYEAVYTRQQIVTKGFEIRPGDFHNVSASRNEGSSLTSNEAGSISDAKLAKFFGINKKTPQEIAIERHTRRDAEAIQKAWNGRRVANIKKAVADGLLPKEAIERLSALPQESLNARIEFLQKTVNRHASRTPQEIADIKDRWAQKQLRDKTIRTRAENILAEAKKWQEVDYSALEKFVAAGNLTKMRDESMSVIKAIRTMRDEEKALADLIPDAHGWHKTFSLSELKEAHGKIQSTLDYWKAKGYDLATDSNLSILKTELEQKIKFVENPGAFKAGLKAHKTWKVQQDAYMKLLDKVENRIEIVKLETDYTTLLDFKTTSKDFSKWMAKAKEAIDVGDPNMAKHWLGYAKWKKDTLESKREGKSATLSVGRPGGVKFDASEFTQKKKDDALWFGGKLSYYDRQIGWNEADKYMTPLAQQN